MLSVHWEPTGFRACCCLSLVLSALSVLGQSTASIALVWLQETSGQGILEDLMLVGMQAPFSLS